MEGTLYIFENPNEDEKELVLYFNHRHLCQKFLWFNFEKVWALLFMLE